MMKNNTLRNKLGLYFEGIRQSKVIGVPFVCFCVLMMIFEVLNNSVIGVVQQPDAGIAAMLIASLVATPLMLLMLFHFLNSRKASDFYHSIPRSRGSLYLSFGAAAATWSIVTITGLSLFEMLGYVVAGHELDTAMWFEMLLVTISANIFIAGGVLLAISISSTVFSQVIISGLILFLPRVLIYCFEDTVTSIVPVLPSFEQAIGFVGSPRANVLIGLLAYDMSGDIIWQSSLYSLVIGIAYAALGMLFFCRRKSETAASPALNRWVQMAVRVIIAFAICLLPTIELAKELNKGVPLSYISEIELMLVFYGVAVIAYFVYEALSNRSIRGMWKSWPELLIGLGILLVLNLTFIFGAGLSAKAVLAFEPENDEVVSISFPTGYRYVSYEDLRIAETELTDDAVTSFLASQMRKDVENISIINNSYRYDSYSGELYSEYTYQEMVQFTMADGRKVIRYVYMSEPQAEMLQQMLLRNRDYVAAATDFPKEYHELYIYGGSNVDSLTEKDIAKLYESYTAEIQNVDPIKYITNDFASIADIEVTGRYDGIEYQSEFPIYLETPKTLLMYIEMTESDESISDVLEKTETASYYNINVVGYNFYNGGIYYEQHGSNFDYFGNYEDVEVTTTTSSYYDDEPIAIELYEYGFLYSAENRELLFDELTANESVRIDVTKPFYVVSITLEYEQIDGMYAYEDYEFFIQAASENSCLELPEFVMDNAYYSR